MNKMLQILLVLFLSLLFFSCKKEEITQPPSNNAPSTPSNPSPADGAASISLSPVLSWTCSEPDGDSVKYDLYFSPVNPPNILLASNNIFPNYTATGLDSNRIYYWRVNAKDSKGAASPSPIWRFTTIQSSGLILFSDNFDDGDFTNNPHWDFGGNNACGGFGTAEVANGEFHVLKTGASGCGNITLIEHGFYFGVTDSTKIVFDINPVFSDVGGGAGWTNEEYPAFVDLRVWNANGDSTDIKFCYNYRGGVSHTNGTTMFVVFPSVPQNVWQRDQLFRIRDYVPAAVRISRIIIGGHGWNYEGRFDNIRISNQ